MSRVNICRTTCLMLTRPGRFALPRSNQLFVLPRRCYSKRRPSILPGPTQAKQAPAPKTPKEMYEENRPRGKKIPYQVVSVAGKLGLSNPTALKEILQKLENDRGRYVELVRHPTESWDGTPESPHGPIVRIGCVADDQAAERKRKRMERDSSRLKEFQFSWTMEARDAQRRVEGARRELAKGVKVNILYGPASLSSTRKWPPHRELKENFQTNILSLLEDVAVERRPLESRHPFIAAYLAPRNSAKSASKEPGNVSEIRERSALVDIRQRFASQGNKSTTRGIQSGENR